MNKNIFRDLTIFSTKIAVDFLGLAFFVIIFSFNYHGLKIVSRTSFIVSGTFLFATYLLSNVYGSLDIGLKKSTPLLQSKVLNFLITNIVTVISVIVMGVHDKVSFSTNLMSLIVVFSLQIVMVKIMVGFGNYVYFKLTKPERTIIFHDCPSQLKKVVSHMERHKKQFIIQDIMGWEDIATTDFTTVDRIFLLNIDQKYLLKCIEKCYLLNVNITYSATLIDVFNKAKSSFVLDDILMYEISSKKLTFFQSIVKRAMDVIVSSIALLVALPIMLIVTICIKLDDGGPVFYSQDRLTIGGKIFKVYKFRSMKQDAGDKPASVDDDRITRVGKFIRKIRIDELPQLLNILIGDMSIVGPRPESVAIQQKINQEVPQFSYRLKVKGGLTGYAQVFGKYNTAPLDKLLFDLEYIENYSVINDIKLMLQTLIVFVKKDSTAGFDNTEDDES